MGSGGCQCGEVRYESTGEAEIRACLDKSKSFELQRGYRLIKKGDSAKYLYMVLSGTLEVRDGDHRASALTQAVGQSPPPFGSRQAGRPRRRRPQA